MSFFYIMMLTIEDLVRNKILYAVMAFMVIVFASSYAIASVTMGETGLLMLDSGLGITSILVIFLAVILTIQSVQAEKEGRTLYVLLTRSDSRYDYMFGKMLGVSLAVSVVACAVMAPLALAAWVSGGVHPISMIQGMFSIVLEAFLATGIALVFAQGSSLFIAILLSMCVIISGHFVSIIHQFTSESESILVQWFGELAYWVIPNFEKINLKGMAGYITSYSTSDMLMVTIYGAIEFVALFVIASVIFSKRNLT